MRTEIETGGKKARSRFEEMMAMAEIQRQRDDRRLDEMRLQSQLQRERENFVWKIFACKPKQIVILSSPNSKPGRSTGLSHTLAHKPE